MKQYVDKKKLLWIFSKYRSDVRRIWIWINGGGNDNEGEFLEFSGKAN